MLKNPSELAVSSALVLLLGSHLSGLVSGQATTDQLNTVQSEYDSLYLSSPYPDGFGIPLKAQGALQVVYAKGPVQLGKSMSASDVSSLPTISVVATATTQNNFKSPNVFTLMLADANALGNPDPQGNYRHYLENGATFGDPDANGTLKLNPGSGTVVTSYAGPGPLPNEGPHRYGWLLFAQPSGFKAPANLSTAGVGPGHWYVNPYVSSSGLGDLVAASFYTVENGHANFTPKPILGSSTNSSKSNTTSAGTNTTLTTGSQAATHAKSQAAGGPYDSSSESFIKGIATGLGVAICGYVLAQ